MPICKAQCSESSQEGHTKDTILGTKAECDFSVQGKICLVSFRKFRDSFLKEMEVKIALGREGRKEKQHGGICWGYYLAAVGRVRVGTEG